MSDFCDIKDCPTAAECGYAGRCLKRSSALPPPESQGPSERSRLATCSLPVLLVNGAASQLEDAARIGNQVGAYLYAESFADLAKQLRAHAASATERQPEENASHEP